MKPAHFVSLAARCPCCGCFRQTIGFSAGGRIAPLLELLAFGAPLANTTADNPVTGLSAPFIAWPAFSVEPVEVFA